jgi:hypothetical protein
VIFNQFEEFGNAIWHYEITGGVIEEIYERIKNDSSRFGAYISATGSAGTIAAGDYLRTRYPHLRVVASEALQCPTLLQLGFGGHRIEGIGDKHVPWIHNVRNTDAVVAVDDEHCMSLMRLFNEPVGHAFLQRQGVPEQVVEQLPLLGISSICNLITCIKTARYYEMDGRDILFTPLTDSMELYGSSTIRTARPCTTSSTSPGSSSRGAMSRSCASCGSRTSGPRPSARWISGTATSRSSTHWRGGRELSGSSLVVDGLDEGSQLHHPGRGCSLGCQQRHLESQTQRDVDGIVCSGLVLQCSI